MKRLPVYQIGLVLLLLLHGLGACRRQQLDPARVDWRVNLDHTKKTPYGTSVAYESFPAYFPGAKRESLTKYFRYTAINDAARAYSDSVHMIVLLGLDFRLVEPEWQQILRFVTNGNEVFLLSATLDPKVCRDLKLRQHRTGSETAPLNGFNTGEESQSSLSIGLDTGTRYGFNGRYINGWFETGIRDTSVATSVYFEYSDGEPEPDGEFEQDEEELAPDRAGRLKYGEGALLRAGIDTAAEVLGHSKNGPDLIRYRIGRGHLTLHAAPLALSNYFLLQPENRPYLDALWHQFPANVSRVYWNEYFQRKAERTSIWSLLQYPAIRYALLIAALTLLLYVAFSIKRRQRIVPVIAPLENASVSFVETVGRLYFNKGNHLNLAEKMVQHFLEWVRTTYYLDTSRLDSRFVDQLTVKSGRSQGEVQALVDIIHGLRAGSVQGTPEFVHSLYRRIRIFYKTAF